MKKPIIVPNVQKMTVKGEKFLLPETVKIDFGALQNDFSFFLKDWLNFEKVGKNADIVLVYNKSIKPQGYALKIDEKIVIEYSEACGAFYAFTTLKQLKLGEQGLIKIEVEDWPEIENRGIMFDVSQGRATTLKLLKDMIDLMAFLKYNQFQLYFDAIVFEYPGLEEFTKGHTCYTVEEIKELKAYCAERFIELVPNQNSFGHMGKWVKKEKLSHLAIVKDDGTLGATLNPLDEGSIELVDKIFGALLPFFDSQLINIGCDETFDLGQGQTKEACEKYGVGRVYMDYLLKLHKLITEKYGKTPMFWDDIAMHHPELIPELPKDMVVIEWGYEFDHPYEKHLKLLRDLGLRFYVAPGTSTWNCFGMRSVNMIENLRTCAKSAIKYGSEGYLLTDWGDGGHPQPYACSFGGYVIGAIYGWHADRYCTNGKKTVYEQAKYFTDKYIFPAENFSLFEWIYRLGKCYHLEDVRIPNHTWISWNVNWQCTPEEIPVVAEYAKYIAEELEGVQFNFEGSDWMVEELTNTCRLIRILANPLKYRNELDTWKREYAKHWLPRSKADDNWGSKIMPGRVDKYLEEVDKIVARDKKLPRRKVDVRWDY